MPFDTYCQYYRWQGKGSLATDTIRCSFQLRYFEIIAIVKTLEAFHEFYVDCSQGVIKYIAAMKLLPLTSEELSLDQQSLTSVMPIRNFLILSGNTAIPRS
ncbi:hypothetical protein T11_7233 [Trichinella zimbabwensis]|uniref:Uncharacterized protein n=1 Tax=Trichinella zimbabwensis TaxID=268475 RepID=A0A0V1I7R5_9BILA|nr:hypothetical protein T11_7233 [Trichinella zimbabwensis]